MQMPFCSKLWDRSPVLPENAITINGTVVVAKNLGLSTPGKSTTLRLFSGTQIDHGESVHCQVTSSIVNCNCNELILGRMQGRGRGS
jgi:hypothetical protein